MKNRLRNHHFIHINAADIYCLRDDRLDTLFDCSILTSVLSPPPLQTSPLNITTHYDKKTLKVLVVLQLLYPHVHIGSLWVFVVTIGYVLYGLSWEVHKRESRLNRFDVYNYQGGIFL